MNVRHATNVSKIVRTDGDFNAVVVNVSNTGASGAAERDRYRHILHHNLGRVPVGCQVILSDAEINVYVLSKDQNKIEVKFTAANANVNLRIW